MRELEGAATQNLDWLALQLLDKCVEDKLVGPVFVTDYPKAVCPLTKARPDDPELVERFELMVAGMELANAYTELNDPAQQYENFMIQLRGQEETMATMDEARRADLEP